MRSKLFSTFVVAAFALASPAFGGVLTMDGVNNADLTKPSKDSRAANLKAQVLLDRARLSPGPIDARRGENFASALRAFQQQNGLKESGELDAETGMKLAASTDPVLIEYKIGAADVKGPFAEKIPDDYEEKAELKRLDYTSPLELLAERFHMDEELLRKLNPGKAFDQVGTVILVANVSVKAVALSAGGMKLEVDKTRKSVRVLSDDGKLVAHYPASIGSEDKPAPSGTLKVVRIAHGPSYTYKPEFKFRGQTTDREVKIAAGPNNPVGSVWIALNQKTYGIHGTAEPHKVGKVASHGCVRMTNWDALAVAKIARRGMPVVFIE